MKMVRVHLQRMAGTGDVCQGVVCALGLKSACVRFFGWGLRAPRRRSACLLLHASLWAWWLLLHVASPLSSAEVFDPQTQTWAPIAPMSTEREDVMVAAVQGKLYAAGGDDRNGDTLDSVEAYDPQQNRWEAVADMGCAHELGALAAL